LYWNDEEVLAADDSLTENIIGDCAKEHDAGNCRRDKDILYSFYI
jgi:hypothetical protein